MPEIISKTAWKASTSPSVSGFLSSRCLLSLSDSVPRAALGRGRFPVAPLPGAAGSIGAEKPKPCRCCGRSRGPGCAPRRAGAAGTPGARRHRPAGLGCARPSLGLVKPGPSKAQSCSCAWRVQGARSPPRLCQAPVSISRPREACLKSLKARGLFFGFLWVWGLGFFDRAGALPFHFFLMLSP